jgi:hypothetical protein
MTIHFKVKRNLFVYPASDRDVKKGIIVDEIPRAGDILTIKL